MCCSVAVLQCCSWYIINRDKLPRDVSLREVGGALVDDKKVLELPRLSVRFLFYPDPL